MPTILDSIVARKHREVELARTRTTSAELMARVAAAPPVRNFFAAVTSGEGGPVRLIAEFKRKSPSAGEIRPGATVAGIAKEYRDAGASALSILTDAEAFGGSIDDLVAAREAVTLPLLRKEFVIDRHQVLEARAAGADAVLLIAECLDDCQLRSLYREIIDLGMTPLVELHDAENLPRVLDLGATLVGINNRDLRTMTTRIEHVLDLACRVPEGCGIVAESGIRDRGDVERLQAAGIDAMLVGESLLKAASPGRAAASLLGRDR